MLILTLFACSSAAILATVNSLTKDRIAQEVVNKVNSAIQDVLPEFDNNPFEEKKVVRLGGAEAVESSLFRESTPDSLTFYPATKNGELVGMAVETFTNQGFSGRITVMVGFLPDGTINKTSVIAHAETPGLGDKIEASKSDFGKQFEGKSPETFRLAVKSDGGDVDAITASTITTRAFCDALIRAYNEYMNLNKTN